MTPTFSIIVPTILRPTLAATLDSIQAAGLTPGDEVLVMVDADHAHKPLPPGVRASRAAPVAVYYSEVSRGGWGGPARNLGVRAAKGSHLLFIDDDDVYRPGALDAIRAMVAESPATMHVWRMLARGGRVVWSSPRLAQGNIGTPMFAVPRHAAGEWTSRYEGDFDFALSSRMNLGGDAVVWHDTVLVDCG